MYEKTERHLKALVGNVEWIYSHPGFDDSLQIVFRVSGELRGLSFERHEHGKVFDAPRLERFSFTEMIVKPMSRDDVLKLVYLQELKGAPLKLLTDAESAENETYFKAAEDKRKQWEQQQERNRQAAERREYERLKGKFEK